MSNNEETGPSDQDADKMDYEGEQEYLDYLTAKQGLQVGLDDGTDADIDTDGAGTDGGAETGEDGTGADAATEKKKQRIRKPNKLGIGRLVITKMALGKFEPLVKKEARIRAVSNGATFSHFFSLFFLNSPTPRCNSNLKKNERLAAGTQIFL